MKRISSLIRTREKNALLLGAPCSGMGAMFGDRGDFERGQIIALIIGCALTFLFVGFYFLVDSWLFGISPWEISLGLDLCRLFL